MKQLDQTPQIIASAKASLVFPPVNALDVSAWNSDNGTIDEFDLELWSSTTSALTAAELFGVSQVPKTIASDTFTAAVTDVGTAVAHGLVVGDGPIRVSSSGTLPAGLEADTDYYVGEAATADTFKLSTSIEGAIEGAFVDITSTGSGTHTLIGAGTAGASSAIRYMPYALLGPAADGAVSLTASRGYQKRFKHRPRTLAYAVSATIDAGNITATATPVRDR